MPAAAENWRKRRREMTPAMMENSKPRYSSGAEKSRQRAFQDRGANLPDVAGEDAVVLNLRTHLANRSQCLRQWSAGLERREQVERLGGGAGFNGQNIGCVGDYLLQLQGRSHAHGYVIFFVAGSGDGIDRCRMRQYFVLAGQRRGYYLRHHESGIESRVARQKRRQAFVERGIDQAFDAPLRDPRQSAERDRHVVERESQRLAVKVAAGDHVAFRLFFIADEDQRVVDGGVHLGLKSTRAKFQRVAHRAVDLGNAAKGVSVLHAAAVDVRLADLAAGDQAAQIRGNFSLSGMRARGVNA